MQVYLFLSQMKNVFLLFWLLILSSTVLAQSFGAQLALGANFSQVDGDQLGGYNKLGANVGVQINREINDIWQAAFEIRYSMKGAKKVIDPDAPPTFSLKLNYQYIEVPLLVKYTRFDKVTVYGGPSVGMNIVSKREENGIESEVDELDFLEFGLNLGGTYHLTEKIGIDLRHSYSFLSVTDNSVVSLGPTWFNRTGWFNRLFTAGIVYKLDR
ncbi:MAG TPA: hypothetical protein DCX01_00835 [Bacteroidetes bacterium]|nr:hypothetical protein [Bacteroidota bacterium]